MIGMSITLPRCTPARPPRAIGIHVALEKAVVARIGVDDAADRAVLPGDLRLDAPPASPVARDHNLAFDVDAKLRELLVVLRAFRS